MKMKICTLTLLTIFTFTIPSLAHEKPRPVNEELKERIVKLIDHPDLSRLDGKRFHAEIEFIITRHNQVLVLAVYTDNLYLDNYIKNKLNYRNVGLKGVPRLTPYRIHMSFVQP